MTGGEQEGAESPSPGGGRGAGFWLEGESGRMMDEVLPPRKAGRAGLGCLLPSLEVIAQPPDLQEVTLGCSLWKKRGRGQGS